MLEARKVVSFILIALAIAFALGQEPTNSQDLDISTIDSRLSELETRMINIENTIDTGLPSIYEFVYELAQNLLDLEDRLTSYAQISIDELGQSLSSQLDELKITINELKVTIDIHDGDILKIYDTLGNLSDSVSQLFEKTANIDKINEKTNEKLQSISLELDIYDQDIVNIYDTLNNKADISLLDELENRLNSKIENIELSLADGVVNRMELLEKYTSMIYEIASSKPSVEDIEEMLNPLKDNITSITNELSMITEKIKKQDTDIVKLIVAVSKLSEQVNKLSGKLSILETLVNELRNK
jgi:chromosome segregation ATPase